MPVVNYYFSPTTLGFYPAVLIDAYKKAGSWPSDAVGVSDETFMTYALSEPPQGKQRGQVNGLPAWVDVPPKDTASASPST